MQIDSLKKVFKELRIPYYETVIDKDNTHITIEVDDSPINRVIGNYGCKTDFEFDSKGNFRNVGIWEQ